MIKALGLISGGLDSILAALVLRRAGVEVAGFTLVTPFFGAEKALAAAQAYNFELIQMDAGEEHLEQVVKNPRYGYGANMNPCIDCHAYMLKKAGIVLEEHGYDFLFTGEVLGQRPMSQNGHALNAVAKASGCAQLLLRPLSAGCLPESAVEKQGLVRRELLPAISGRGRKMQMALAQELGVKDYPAPGGGCLLTDPAFSRRLRDLLNYQPACACNRAELLKYGRHFRISAQSKLVIGRNQQENSVLQQLRWPELQLMRVLDLPGPLGLYDGGEPDAEQAARLLAAYVQTESAVKVQAGDKVLKVIPFTKREAQEFLL